MYQKGGISRRKRHFQSETRPQGLLCIGEKAKKGSIGMTMEEGEKRTEN